MSVDNGWRRRHEAARRVPTAREREVVRLIETIELIVTRRLDGQDALLCEVDYLLTDDVVVPLLRAARSFLNWDHGMRLDMGELDSELIALCDRVGFCPDKDEVAR